MNRLPPLAPSPDGSIYYTHARTETAANYCLQYFHLASATSAKKPIAIFDFDDTLAGATEHKPLPEIVCLVKQLVKSHSAKAVCLITARVKSVEQVSHVNRWLMVNGITFDQMYFKPTKQEDTRKWKASVRQTLSQTNDILLCVGDCCHDLEMPQCPAFEESLAKDSKTSLITCTSSSIGGSLGLLVNSKVG